MEQQPAQRRARRSGSSIKGRILLPLVIALFVQAGLFSANIVWGGTVDKLNHNAFDILNGQVINRRNYLQNAMLQRWSNLSPTAQNISRMLERQPEASDMPEEALPGMDSPQSQALLQSAPSLVSLLRRNSVTGVFLILADGESYDDVGRLQKHALYIRDMDPSTSSPNNSDLQLLHAPARLSKQLSIPLDSNWRSYISFDLEDPKSWSYYREPYEAALAYPETTVEDLGYWSPARIAGDTLEVITYSMPLRDEQGAVRAVLGVEISLDYLRKEMPYQELHGEKKGMYLLGLAQGEDLDFGAQLSTGPVFKYLFGEPERMRFIAQAKYTDAIRVESGAGRGKDTVYGCIQYFDLYNTNTPFENERWALIGMMERSALLDFSQGMIWSILLIWAISLLLGFATASVASMWLAMPITRLLRQLRGSDPRRPLALDKLMITEIDELSGAIEALSARVAREASRLSQIIDMAGVEIGAFESRPGENRVFCTARFFEMLGLKAELASDGTIDRQEFSKLMDSLAPRVEDQTADRATQVLRIARPHGEDGWVRLNVAVSEGRTLGVVSDITQEIRKRRQIEKERDYDLLTGLLNRRAFIAELARRFQYPDRLGIAAMVMLDADNLKSINDSYGHAGGDAYLRGMADALRRNAPPKALIARMSGDEFYVFLCSCSTRQEAEQHLQKLREGLKRSTFLLPDRTRFHIRASGGVAWYPTDADSYDKLLKYADFAMYQVKNTRKGELGEFNLETYSRGAYPQ